MELDSWFNAITINLTDFGFFLSYALRYIFIVGTLSERHIMIISWLCVPYIFTYGWGEATKFKIKNAQIYLAKTKEGSMEYGMAMLWQKWIGKCFDSCLRQISSMEVEWRKKEYEKLCFVSYFFFSLFGLFVSTFFIQRFEFGAVYKQRSRGCCAQTSEVLRARLTYYFGLESFVICHMHVNDWNSIAKQRKNHVFFTLLKLFLIFIFLLVNRCRQRLNHKLDCWFM